MGIFYIVTLPILSALTKKIPYTLIFYIVTLPILSALTKEIPYTSIFYIVTLPILSTLTRKYPTIYTIGNLSYGDRKITDNKMDSTELPLSHLTLRTIS